MIARGHLRIPLHCRFPRPGRLLSPHRTRMTTETLSTLSPSTVACRRLSPSPIGPAEEPNAGSRWLPSVTDRLNRPLSARACVLGWFRLHRPVRRGGRPGRSTHRRHARDHLRHLGDLPRRHRLRLSARHSDQPTPGRPALPAPLRGHRRRRPNRTCGAVSVSRRPRHSVHARRSSHGPVGPPFGRPEPHPLDRLHGLARTHGRRHCVVAGFRAWALRLGTGDPDSDREPGARLDVRADRLPPAGSARHGLRWAPWRAPGAAAGSSPAFCSPWLSSHSSSPCWSPFLCSSSRRRPSGSGSSAQLS